jgi:hypothetical protein
MGEGHATGGKGVEVWCLSAFSAGITAQVISACGIKRDKEDIAVVPRRRVICGFFGTLAGYRKNQQESKSGGGEISSSHQLCVIHSTQS